MDSDGKSLQLLNQLIEIELRQIRELGALIADRVDQDATGIEVDSRTGEVLGLLSDTARAARYAIAQRIIKKGGEDPGWGR